MFWIVCRLNFYSEVRNVVPLTLVSVSFRTFDICFRVKWWCSSYLGRLLIWEDWYYEPSPCSAPCISGSETFKEWEGSWDSLEIHSSQLRSQLGDRVHSLINDMMINNQVYVVGEGYDFLAFILFYLLLQVLFLKLSVWGTVFIIFFRIVGRAAFTGHHQWILSKNYNRDAHLSEVRNRNSASGLTRRERGFLSRAHC